MTLLDPPLLATLELHIAPSGRWQLFTEPRDLAHYPDAVRVAILATAYAALDQLAKEMKLTLTVTPTGKATP